MRQITIFVVVFTWLCIAAYACAGESDYEYFYKIAADKKKPFVVMVNVDVRTVKGCVTVSVDSINGSDRPRINVVPDAADLKATWELPASASDERITRAAFPAERLVQPSAVPFERSSRGELAATADGNDPWFSREETAKIKAKWPKSAKWSDGIKFYRLAPRYQFLTTMNGGRTKVNTITTIHDSQGPEDRELTLSGGLVHLGGWTSVKGIDFVGKKVKVWQENTEVRAFAQVPRWRWRFAEGTVAYDALFNSDSGKPFEIRV